MHSLRNILGKFVRDFGLEGGVAVNAVRRQWADLVGQTVAAHTFPDTIRGGILTLIVDTPQWMHHLGFYREEISSKLKPFNISGIRFRLGVLPGECAKRPAEEGAGLTEEDLRYIENTVRNVKDEELKEKFRTLIAHGLTRGRLRSGSRPRSEAV